MGIQFLPILKTIPTIVVAVREVTASLSARRNSGAVVKIEERTKKLEDDLLKAGTALTELATQVQAIAEELRAQAETNSAQQRKIVIMLWVSVAALAGAIGATVIPLLAR